MRMKLGQSKATMQAVAAIAKPALPTKKLQMNIPEELHKAFKLACTEQDKDMTEVTIELIKRWIELNK